MKEVGRIKTLVEILDKLLALGRDKMLLKNCEGSRWKTLSIRDFHQSIEDIALRILSLGIQREDRIAIFSDNCWQWMAADFAIMTSGAITVPLFPTLPSDQIQFILQNSEARAIFISDKKKFTKIESLKSSLPDLQWIVTFEEVESCQENCWSMERFVKEGRERRHDLYGELQQRKSSVQPNHIASIIYTSGTTGEPKGVMLSQNNFLSNIEATLDLVKFGSQDVGLSFLPLSHVFERLVDYGYLYHGATIYFASVERLMKHFEEVHPTVAASVPRIFELIQERLLARLQASSAMKKRLFQWGMAIGRKRGDFLLSGQKPSLGLQLLFLLVKGIVFRPLHKNLGRRFRFFISGGGPLLPEIGKFFYAMGITICEGYGLTETSPVVAVNTPHDVRFGTVGRIVEGVRVKISEDGEILVKGPNVMKGYYKNEAATREAFQEGWFCTGDTGELMEGYLRIKERKKDIIVTSSGKNISPQRIENYLKRSSLINNAVVFGDAMDYISALIVPNFDILKGEMDRMSLPQSNRDELVKNERVIDLYKKEVFSTTKSLAVYEKVRKFVLLDKDFTIESGEMTPTLKIKRRVVFNRYRQLIESMYPKTPGYEEMDH